MCIKNHIKNCLAFIGLLVFSPVQAAEDWVADEIFKQINELRRDNNLLRKDVEQLKKELAQVKASNAKSKRIPKVSLDDDPMMGKSDAKIAIVEFTDYECPYCKRHTFQTLPKIKANYIDTGKVKYVLRDFPLDFHKKAKSAAIAANCAGEQGDYWNMHEKLFSKKIAFNKKGYLRMAKSMNLNTEMFTKCLDDPEQAKEVDKDLKYGETVGVRGTPAFFVGKLKNGQVIDAQFIRGAQGYSRFSKVIDSLMN